MLSDKFTTLLSAFKLPVDKKSLHIIQMYQIGIFTIWPEPDSGQIVEWAIWPDLDFTTYQILT